MAPSLFSCASCHWYLFKLLLASLHMGFQVDFFGLVVIVFYRTKLTFIFNGSRVQLPLIVYFFLIGLLIWVGENIATLLGAWHYPDQQDGWQLVHLGKISSWLLLVIVSFLIVANLKIVKEKIT